MIDEEMIEAAARAIVEKRRDQLWDHLWGESYEGAAIPPPLHDAIKAQASAALAAVGFDKLVAVAEMAQRPERDACDQYHTWHDKLKVAATAALASPTNV